jgi:hypothetical protein
MPSRLNAACCTRSKMSRQVRHSPEHKRIRGRRGHVESSRATAISNVIPAINTWPKTAMVNSIWPLLGICLVPRQWTRCTKWQRIVNESLPPTVTPPPRKPAVGASRCAGAPACGVGLGCVQHFLELIHNVLLHEEPQAPRRLAKLGWLSGPHSGHHRREWSRPSRSSPIPDRGSRLRCPRSRPFGQAGAA